MLHREAPVALMPAYLFKNEKNLNQLYVFWQLKFSQPGKYLGRTSRTDFYSSFKLQTLFQINC